MEYLTWRVLTKRNPTVKISFMIPGHTKFAPDRFFGLIKKLYRHTAVSTLVDIERVIWNSTTSRQNIPLSTVDTSGKRNVIWYRWTEYLSFFFRPIPGISQYHHFRVDASVPNKIFMKTYEESEELEYEICSGDGSSKLSEMPTVINPFGMSQERKQYLCDKIRQFCPSEASANLTCPKANMPISQMFPISYQKILKTQFSYSDIIGPFSCASSQLIFSYIYTCTHVPD